MLLCKFDHYGLISSASKLVSKLLGPLSHGEVRLCKKQLLMLSRGAPRGPVSRPLLINYNAQCNELIVTLDNLYFFNYVDDNA